MRTVPSGSFHAYAIHDTTHPNVKNTVYLDSSGRIARMDIDAQIVTFSRFGQRVSIQAPM
jgi:hypothetical protein